MTNISRRQFLATLGAAPVVGSIVPAEAPYTYTVTGKLPVAEMGATLIHEHVLVDFIGADKISPACWKHDDVIRKVLPYLLEIKERGIKTLVECTPAFIGRDVALLKKLSEQSGLHIFQYGILWRFRQQVFTQMGIHRNGGTTRKPLDRGV